MMHALIVLPVLASLAATPPPPAPPATGDNQKMVCKTTRLLGSNRTQRLCQTKELWERGRKKAKEMLDYDRGAPAPNERSLGRGIGG